MYDSDLGFGTHGYVFLGSGLGCIGSWWFSSLLLLSMSRVRYLMAINCIVACMHAWASMSEIFSDRVYVNSYCDSCREVGEGDIPINVL